MLPPVAQAWLDSVDHILECPDTLKAVEAFKTRTPSEWSVVPTHEQGAFLSASIEVFEVFNSDIFHTAWEEIKAMERLQEHVEKVSALTNSPIILESGVTWAKPIVDMLGRQKSKQAACIRCLASMLDDFGCDKSKLPVSAYQFALSVILNVEVETATIYRAL